MTPAEQIQKINQLIEFHEINARKTDGEEYLLFRQTVLMLGMLKTRVAKELLPC